LGDIREVYALIVDEMKDLKQRYPDARRTEIAEQEGEIEDESLIPNDRMLVVLSHQGYIKRMPLSTYRQQGRGGKGIVAMAVNARNGKLIASFPVAQDDEINNGTDPTKFITIAEAKYEYLDLNGGFGSETLRLSYTQPFGGDRYNIRARLPVAAVDVFGDDSFDIGEVSRPSEIEDFDGGRRFRDSGPSIDKEQV
jgi:hypothetical protein